MENKTLVEKGKMLSNFMKVISVLFVVGAYILLSIINKRPLQIEEVKGLFLVGFYIYSPFLPIDASLIIKNIFGIKKENSNG